MMRNSSGLKLAALLAVSFLGLSLISCGGSKSSSSSSKPVKGGITRIDITYDNNAVFEGHDFPSVGTYTMIKGTAYGTIDPNDPRNQVITDIALAPVNDNGLVEYETMFYILTPTNPAKRGKVMFEPPNRGNKQFATFNQSGGGNTVGDSASDIATDNSTTVPRTPATLPGFLFNKGYTTVWAAWDMEPNSIGGDSLSAKLPIAKNPDNTSITGPVYEYLVAGNSTTNCQNTYYNPDDDDTNLATLTVRDHLTDTPVPVASNRWQWNGSGTCTTGSANANSISLLDGGGLVENFAANKIYELEYIAKDPYVATAGFAAMRDFVSFLRYANEDSEGNANPLAGNIQQIMVWTNSQPGRLMNDYIWLGFNEDLHKRKVFDGTINYIGGGDGLGINYRFAQVGRTERNRQNHIAQLEGVFPFSYTTTTDALTGKTDGRNVRCTNSNTCPKVMNLYSSNEMWVKTASLATTHPNTGADLVEPANVRNYQISGAQHGNGSEPSTNIAATAANLYPTTTVDPQPVYRALWVAMEEWIANGTLPPASRVPRVDNGTLVLVPTDNATLNDLGIGLVPKADLIGFDGMPEELLPMDAIVVTVRNYWDFGAQYNKGILDKIPPIPTGDYYKVYVPVLDSTGNELGGIRLPEVEAPLGSNVGWNIRSAAGSGKADGTDGAEGTGAFIPLAPTNADITGDCANDPRPTLETLYGSADGHAAWLAKREEVAADLLAERFLLPEDAANYNTSGLKAFTVGTNAHHLCWYPHEWKPTP